MTSKVRIMVRGRQDNVRVHISVIPYFNFFLLLFPFSHLICLNSAVLFSLCFQHDHIWRIHMGHQCMGRQLLCSVKVMLQCAFFIISLSRWFQDVVLGCLICSYVTFLQVHHQIISILGGVIRCLPIAMPYFG